MLFKLGCQLAALVAKNTRPNRTLVFGDKILAGASALDVQGQAARSFNRQFHLVEAKHSGIVIESIAVSFALDQIKEQVLGGDNISNLHISRYSLSAKFVNPKSVDIS